MHTPITTSTQCERRTADFAAKQIDTPQTVVRVTEGREPRRPGLPLGVARLSGVAVYLDNWAIIELENGAETRRERFVYELDRAWRPTDPSRSTPRGGSPP